MPTLRAVLRALLRRLLAALGLGALQLGGAFALEYGDPAVFFSGLSVRPHELDGVGACVGACVGA